MKIFLTKGESCSYDNESIHDIEVSLRYKHLVKQWVPMDLTKINTNFFVNERIYHIVLSLLHGLGIFSMDVAKLCHGILTELMEHVRPCYVYNDWVQLVQYTKSMWRYGVAANYIQLKDNDLYKGTTMYIDGRPKAVGNIARFIDNTRPVTTNKQPNFIF